MSDQAPSQPSRSPRRRRGTRRSSGGGGGGGGQSLWRAVPAPDPSAPIEPVADPTAFITSLDAPPLRGGHMTEHYIAAVVERAAMLATALAASVDLLAERRDET